MSTRDARDVAYDGIKALGDGEEVVDDNSGSGCMGMRQFYELSYRGHNNNFIGLYIEDPNCGDAVTNVLPPFVKCSGPGAIIPEDGASCTCGENSQWNSDTAECECLPGYMGSIHVIWRRNPVCTLCSGVGAVNDYYGVCQCGDGSTLNDQGVCVCNDGLVPEPDNQYCYDGIDSVFDDTKVSYISRLGQVRSNMKVNSIFSTLAKQMKVQFFLTTLDISLDWTFLNDLVLIVILLAIPSSKWTLSVIMFKDFLLVSSLVSDRRVGKMQWRQFAVQLLLMMYTMNPTTNSSKMSIYQGYL